jgi:hypothetical protein
MPFWRWRRVIASFLGIVRRDTVIVKMGGLNYRH